MNTVINYDSGTPSDPLRGYSYVHDSNFRIAATMHCAVIVMCTIRIYDNPAGSRPRCTNGVTA